MLVKQVILTITAVGKFRGGRVSETGHKSTGNWAFVKMVMDESSLCNCKNNLHNYKMF